MQVEKEGKGSLNQSLKEEQSLCYKRKLMHKRCLLMTVINVHIIHDHKKEDLYELKI